MNDSLYFWSGSLSLGDPYLTYNKQKFSVELEWASGAGSMDLYNLISYCPKEESRNVGLDGAGLTQPWAPYPRCSDLSAIN